MGTDQLAKKAGTGLSPAAQWSKRLEVFKKQMSLALPKHLNADRMTRLILTAFSQNPKLFECNENSVYASIITASQLGLEVGVGGQGYLVPYAGRCQFVPGWRGLVNLVNRSKDAAVWTGAVFQGDRFDYSLGSNPSIEHKPGDEFEVDKLTHVYACGKVNGAEIPTIEIWPIEKVKKHRDRFNKVGKRHYSFEHLEMYARKVALLQVLKYMPQSIELTAATELANRSEHGGEQVVLDTDFQVIEQKDEDAEQTVEGESKETSKTPAGDAKEQPAASKPKGTARRKAKTAEKTEPSEPDAKDGDLLQDQAGNENPPD